MTSSPTTLNRISDLIIFSNSPGEVSTWVRSVCEAVHQADPDVAIHVYLLPCQYATGHEHEVAAKFKGVVEVLRPRQTWWHLLRLTLARRRLKALHSNTVILSLGGDPFYAVWLGWITGSPRYLYTEHRGKFNGFRRVFRSFEEGDLMAASIPISLPPPAQTCLFLCGSRPQHFIHWFPIVAQGIDILKSRYPGFPAEVLISPFLSERVVSPLLEKFASSALLIRRDSDTLSVIARAKLVVTIPGTNTAQCMYLRRPMLVFMPLNRPSAMLLDGLPGLIGKIPLIGPLFMQVAVAIMRRRIRFFSKPNRLLQADIVPEVVDVITPAEFARRVFELYDDKVALRRMQDQLSEIPIPRNAATLLWARLKADVKAIDPKTSPYVLK